MSKLSQANRRIRITTPLGEDVLLLRSLAGAERMSRLFRFSVQLFSEAQEVVKPADIVGKAVTITVLQPDDTERFFHGHVARFTFAGRSDRVAHYNAEIVPWFWFLTQTTDCRIFQQKSIPDIISQIFGEYGLNDFELKISGSHVKWEYCVQYRETDFNFISRLMEEEGIYYYFRHEQDKHVMVVSDSTSGYADAPAPDDKASFASNLSEKELPDNITKWEHNFEFRPGKSAHTDYNFQTPKANLLASIKSKLSVENIGKFEFYDFPGGYEKRAEGDNDIALRMEELESAHDVVEGAGSCRAWSPGLKFTMDRHHVDAEEGKGYVLTAVQHTASVSGAFMTGESQEVEYENTFVAIPDSISYRPPRITPKPFVRGIQTAVVVGPAGQEIFTDKFGRVKVHFFWDREGARDDNSSCFVRVSQPWAGANWGAIFNPRIGQEVIVSFVEGDPDRPLITGRVYNADNMPPYELPANQTQSGIKSRSSPGGSGANFNEIRFEDKKGAEQVYIHAEKNEDIVVENDKTESVGHDETIDIGNDRTETVGHDETITIHNNQTHTIDVNRTDHVGANEDRSVGGNRSRTVGGNESVSVGGNRDHTIGVNETITVGASQTINIGATQTVTIGAAQATTIGGAHDINVGGAQATNVGGARGVNVGGAQNTNIGGKNSLTVGGDMAVSVGGASGHSSGKDLSISSGAKAALAAKDEISIGTGDASIVLKKDGTIEITGKDITITASGKLTAKASSNMTLKGSKITGN